MMWVIYSFVARYDCQTRVLFLHVLLDVCDFLLPTYSPYGIIHFAHDRCIHLRDEFHFSEVHESMNTTGHVQSK